MTTEICDTFETRLEAWPHEATTPCVVLFDIDRTLLDTCGGNFRAMTRAGRSVFGDAFSLDGIDRSGRLDAHIVMDAASRLGETLQATQFNAFRDLYAEELKAELDGQCAMPGAVAWVQRLSAIEGVTLGLVTGNFGSAAAVKIPALGLDFGLFTANGFGDAGERRSDLVRIARMQTLRVPIYRTLIIGDTPRDIECARANGCPCLCVATGDFDAETLYASGAKDVVADLTAQEATAYMASFLTREEPV